MGANSFSRVGCVCLLCVLLFVGSENDYSARAQDCDARTGRCDAHERCPVWAAEGECSMSTNYMMKHCPGSCGNLASQRLQSQQQQQVVERTSQEDGGVASCEDLLERCPVFAEVGECDSNPEQMRKFCRRSCGLCHEEEDGGEPCENTHDRCDEWAQRGECARNEYYMTKNCPLACGTCGNGKVKAVEVDPVVSLMDKTTEFGEYQKAEGAEAGKTLQRIQSTVVYLDSEEVTKLPHKVRRGCKNRHELCTFWQVIGECEKNPAYMTTNCAPACHTCHMIDFSNRCPPLPADTPPAFTPGDLDKMFTRIVTTAPGNQTETSVNPDMPPYTVTIHSSPSDNGRPWVISFDNFLTDEETDALIQHGYEEEYKRSEDVGKEKFDGSFDSVQSSSRTSENSWCSAFKGCRWKEVPSRVLDRISAVTGVPGNHSEDLQLLKYEPGQFYRTHHDYIEHQQTRNCGPRILTFFLYLSDVEEGGGTNFPSLGLTVQPKRGRALLWPSVLNDAPMTKDARMEHQALPVEKGTKFAANAWLHMFDYVTPQEKGCN